MTVLNETDWVFYSGDGVTTVFPIPFKLFAKADCRIVQIDADGVPTVKALTTDYTIPTSDLGASEGNATMLVAPPVGERLLVRRSRELTQTTRIRDNSEYNAGLHENAIDALLMQTQSLKYTADRSLQFPETEEDAPDVAVLPSVTERANKYIKFDADGNPEYVTDAVSETSKFWGREGTLTTGSNANFPFYRAHQTETYTRMSLQVDTAPVGSAISVEIVKNGVTVVATLEIPDGETYAEDDGLSISLVDGDYIRPSIALVGSTSPGTTLTVTVLP